ncbi:MAG: DUF1501 domain-containing protein [Verrucomicrobia bacterium]|nr:DUF1501 domain-containing protein [Verrucomicrobiota bacterium]MDA1069488.1 DUF1501 domain-containing protein [Verrucomicrobiota bacterium]
MPCHHYDNPFSRRDFLRTAGCGFGSLALSALTGLPLAHASKFGSAKIPHARARAKNIIWLFMEGGPSHLDLFDPKPLLNKLAGQPLPESFEKPVTAMGEASSPLLESRRKWAQHGEGGLWISDWLPNHSKIADELCVIRSCVSDGINHAGGVCQMNTGSVFGGRPSLGSWVDYGLGSVNNDLPGFVVIKDTDAMVVNGARSWGAGFMPSTHQGVLLESGVQPIANLHPPQGFSMDRQSQKLEFINQLNAEHLAGRESNTDLEARIRSYEMAYRMQAEAPEAVDLSLETEETKRLYGMDRKETEVYGRNCLLARRLVERGVRFIQLYHGAGSKWDSHDHIEKDHSELCAAVDQPIVGLIQDLKRRGLLEETLVVWGGEFGRTPMSEKGDGRDHNPTGFTMWMAGGGVHGGTTVGSTDELGLYAVEDKVHVHDLHATMFALLGLDHTKVVYMHKGRPERVDVNEGHVVASIMGA